MRRAWLLGVLFFSTATFYLGVSILLKEPGYMDACYYFSVAEAMAEGKGLVEPFLWNYLDSPASIPHPAFTYWMPLPSFLAWPFLKLPGAGYLAARLPFVILASLLPILSYRVAEVLQEKVSEKDKSIPILAALLTLFSGFYVVYWPSTDNFAPFALAGALCLFLWGRIIEESSIPMAFLAGAAAGFAHLARADGFLLLLPLAFFLITPQKRRLALVSTIAYFLVMGPWLIRNVMVLGLPLPVSGAKTVFLTHYDDLFSYEKELSWRSYLAWGLGAIIVSKLRAGWLNLQTIIAVFLMVFLTPPFLTGLRRLYRSPFLKPFILYAVTLFLVMTFVFTYPGPRGSFFHSGGALLPFTAAVSALGLSTINRAWARKRGVNSEDLWRLNFVGAVFLAFIVSSFALYRATTSGQWDSGGEVYRSVEAWLRQSSSLEATVMVVDPPCFYYHTKRTSIAIPNGDEEIVLRVARRYSASFLLLEPDHPRPLSRLYSEPYSYPGLEPVAFFGRAILFRIKP
ncbi:MAG: glycosyltransferase family 39 protein [Anaerolineae bacterium]|nr:glycosyltransferase family 39 protein [Anaerolineae bacterium]